MVLRSKTSGKVPMGPGMVEVIVHVIAAGVVSDPFAVGVHVRRVGMARLITEMPSILRRGMLFGRMLLLRTLLRLVWSTLLLGTFGWMRHRRRLRATIGNVHSGSALRGSSWVLVMLRDGRQRRQYENSQNRQDAFHHVQTSTTQICEVFERWMSVR